MLVPRHAVAAALAVGLALGALALGLVLSSPSVVVVGSNLVPAEGSLGGAKGGASGCELGGTVPAGTTAVRIGLGANIGPKVSVAVLSRERVIASGQRPAGWGIAESVTVPVSPITSAVENARTCFRLGPTVEAIEGHGGTVEAVTNTGKKVRAQSLRIEYLKQGPSWWSQITAVAHRMGLGHAPEGTWIVFVELALMIAVVTMAVRLALRTLGPDSERPAPEDGGGPGATVAKAAKRVVPARGAKAARARPSRSRPSGGDGQGAGLAARSRAQLRSGLSRIPRAAVICGVIAVLNAACWSVITPPFQVPDEPSHFAYVQLLYENDTLPQSEFTDWSEEERVALMELHHQQVRFHPEVQAIRTNAEEHRLAEELARPLGRTGGGGAGVAHSQPPLYYALQTVPYFASSSGSILDQLEVMRLFSALFAGLTALFVFMFVREALPRVRWAWTVGGLTIAAAPLLGFMSGAVNPDSMFYAVSAAGFFALARGFRRGLTRPLAACIGAIIAVGLLTKLNFIGETPGMIVGLLVLSLRQARAARREAVRSAALGVGIAILPGVLYLLDNLVRGRAVLGSATQLQSPNGGHGSLLNELGYIWQFYLPKLPGMTTDFPGLAPWHALWFDRWVGLYGWLDTVFPLWVDKAAFVVAIGLVVLAVLGVLGVLPATRSARVRRLSELAVYALIAIGLLVMIGAASYLEFPSQAGRYAEPRYMMPLIALAGVWAALSARGAGQVGAWIGARGIRGASSRWGPVAGALIVALVLAWDIFSQLQTIARFYG